MIYNMSKVKYIFTEWPTAIAKMFSIEYEVIMTNYLKTLSNLCSKYFVTYCLKKLPIVRTFLHKTVQQGTAPLVLQQKWLPTAPGVCVCVCSLLTVVCVHLDGWNAEHIFRVWDTILGHISFPFKSLKKWLK